MLYLARARFLVFSLTLLFHPFLVMAFNKTAYQREYMQQSRRGQAAWIIYVGLCVVPLKRHLYVMVIAMLFSEVRKTKFVKRGREAAYNRRRHAASVASASLPVSWLQICK